MRSVVSIVLGLLTVLSIGWPAAAQDAAVLRVVGEQTVGGFAFPESVAYDPRARVLYVSQFGPALKPAEKDGKGKISKVGLDGTVLEDRFLPPAGATLHKPKGMWVDGHRLWVTDIDAVWVFDLQTRRGRKAELSGIKFANDLVVTGNVLYVTDNRGDQLYRVEPADLLDTADPKVTLVVSGQALNPNGIHPTKDGALLIVGFMAPDQARGIYVLSPGGEVKPLVKDLGRLDGVYPLEDGTLLVTEWNAGVLARWSAKGGVEPLARGFKGPADFCVVPEAGGLLVVVPDLVKSELRLVRLAR